MNTLSSLKDTEKIAHQIAKKISNGGVLLLFGDLGAGKTTLTKFIAEELGIDKFKVKSPTYTYIRNYNNNFYHLDLYRLDEIDELLLQEVIEIWEDPNNIVVIEWPEKLGANIPSEHIAVTLTQINETTREINIEDVS